MSVDERSWKRDEAWRRRGLPEGPRSAGHRELALGRRDRPLPSAYYSLTGETLLRPGQAPQRPRRAPERLADPRQLAQTLASVGLRPQDAARIQQQAAQPLPPRSPDVTDASEEAFAMVFLLVFLVLVLGFFAVGLYTVLTDGNAHSLQQALAHLGIIIGR